MTPFEAAQRLEAAIGPHELVPIDVEAAGAVAGRLATMAERLDEAHRELRQLESVPGWRGAASSAFERRADRLPERSADAVEVFGAVAGSFRRLAAETVHAAGQISHALLLWQQSRLVSEQWRAAVDAARHTGEVPHPLPSDDPGGDERARAVAIYLDGHDRIEAATERALTTMAFAGEAAPGVDELLGGQGPIASVSSFALGAVDSARGIAQLAWDFNPVRAAVDPEGWRADAREVRDGIVHLVEHPDQIDDVVLDLDTLRDDPSRWLGQLLALDLAVALTTSGSSVVATRAAATTTRLARSTTRLDDLRRALRLPDLEVIRRRIRGSTVFASEVRERAVRAAAQPDPPRRRELAERYGGEPDDYEHKVVTIEVDDGGGSLTFEFVHDIERDHIHEPRVVQGEICEPG